MLCLWNLMLPKYNCELHFLSVFALFEVIMSSGIALGTQRSCLSLNTCSEFKYAELSFLHIWCSGPSEHHISAEVFQNVIIFTVVSCFFEALIVPNSTNINSNLNFLYRIIHRRPSSLGSLPPGCRRWVSRLWGRNGGRCRCLPVSQAEQSETEKRGRDDKHTFISHQQKNWLFKNLTTHLSFTTVYHLWTVVFLKHDFKSLNLNSTSSWSALSRSFHSSIGRPRSMEFMGIFTSPMTSCLENLS